VAEPTPVRSNAELRRQLDSLIKASKPLGLTSEGCSAFDVIITYHEINCRHGTGFLLRRIFKDCSCVLTIRSVDTYDGKQSFGQIKLCLPALGMTRARIFETVSSWLSAISVKRIVCVPWTADEVITAIAVKEITNADLCMYVMDDQNITQGLIPDDVMHEALFKSRLRLVISPEMRSAYQNKYNLKFWVMPPIVDHRLLRSDPSAPANVSNRGVMVGNVWSAQWLKLLRGVLRHSGIQVDWYSTEGLPWLKLDSEELKQDGITLLAGLPEDELACTLSRYDFAIIPTGTLDEADDNRWIAQLSLPSKVPFIAATAHTPLIVVGSPNTAAARFVTRFGIGATCDYDTRSFQLAVRHVAASENQRAIRDRSRELAPVFSDLGIGEWLHQALEHAEPPDLKFEKLFEPQPDEVLQHVEPLDPKSVQRRFHPTYQSLRRLKAVGFSPDFVVSLGSSDGVWPQTIRPLFPHARLILIEAFASGHCPGAQARLACSDSDFEPEKVAMSNNGGGASPNLNNGSHPRASAISDAEEVIGAGVATLDELATERGITGRGLLKIDALSSGDSVFDGTGAS
jgi:hypothetical protein